MPGVIDSFFVALGFKVDPKGIDEMKAKTESARDSILSMGTALTGLVAGLALHKVAEIGSAFEQNRIQIAGFLNALGLSSDFNGGLKDAEGIIAKITADAARLPGEAEEYVEVFKTNAAYLKNGLPGANASQIADFTNKLTAVAKTVASTMDAGQIARESSQLLAGTGRAGGHNVLWQKLLPFLMQVDGQAKITAQSFNAMTQPKRVELLKAAFAKLQPALDASANSFDAMWGAMVSGVKQLTRIGTAGLFEGMKDALAGLNAEFFNTDGTMTQFGTDTVETIGKLSRFVMQAVHSFVTFGKTIMGVDGAGTALKIVLGGLATLLAGAVWEKTIAKVVSLAKGLRLATMVSGFLWIALGLIAEDLWTFYNNGESVTGMLVSRFQPALYGVIFAALALAFALAPILTSILAIVVAGWFLYKNWGDIVGGMKLIWSDFVDSLKFDGSSPLGRFLPKEWQKQGSQADRETAEGNAHDEKYRRNIAILHARHVGDAAMSGGDTGASAGPVGYTSPAAPSMATGGMSIDPRSIGSGFGAGTTNNVKIGDINIVAPDAKAAGHEVRRVLRTSLSGVVR